jgi:hypothetical protein
VDVQAAETVDLGGLAQQQQVGSVDCASRSPGRRCGRRRRAGRDRRSGRRPCRQPARSADAEAKVPPLRMEIVRRSDDMKGFVVSAAPLGCRAPFLLVRTQPASRQGLRKPYRNPGHLRYPRLHSAGPQAARQGVGPDDGGLQSIVKRPSPERPARTGTRRLRTLPPSPRNGEIRPLRAIPGPRPWMLGPARERTFVPDFRTCQLPAHASPSSSAFASFRSAVSKPSVNQP